VSPSQAAFGIWVTGGGLSCLLNGLVLRAVATSKRFTQSRAMLEAIIARSGYTPLYGAALVLLLLGPVGLAVSLFQLGRVFLGALVAAVRDSWREAREEALTVRVSREFNEHFGKQLFAECPSCKRTVMLEQAHSLPTFPDHPDVTFTGTCPGSGKNTMGLKVVRGETLGLKVETP
jgi:hypothetical protein